jgi:hypothetical protein
MADEERGLGCFGMLLFLALVVLAGIPVTFISLDFWSSIICYKLQYACEEKHLIDWNFKPRAQNSDEVKP